MAKFLLFLVVIAVIYFVVRASNRRNKPPAATATESMVRCAHCGVHFPGAEAVSGDGGEYSCEAHRRLGPGP